MNFVASMIAAFSQKASLLEYYAIVRNKPTKSRKLTKIKATRGSRHRSQIVRANRRKAAR